MRSSGKPGVKRERTLPEKIKLAFHIGPNSSKGTEGKR